MNRQRLSLTVIHQRASSSVNFHKFAMYPAFFIPIHSYLSGISGIVPHHRECFIIIIRHHDSSQFSRLCRFITVHFQYFRIEIIQINGVFRIFSQLNTNKPVFIVAIRTYRRKSEQFFNQIIRGIRQSLSHRKYHLYLPFFHIPACSFKILCQCSQCTGISHQYLYFFLFDIPADSLKRLISHIGDIDHNQIIFERLPFADGVFSFDPCTKLSSLHSHTKTVQFHTGNEIHIDTIHLIPVTQNSKRCARRTAGTQFVKISLLFAGIGQNLIVMFYIVTFCKHRKIREFFPFRMIFIIG